MRIKLLKMTLSDLAPSENQVNCSSYERVSITEVEIQELLGRPFWFVCFFGGGGGGGWGGRGQPLSTVKLSTSRKSGSRYNSNFLSYSTLFYLSHSFYNM